MSIYKLSYVASYIASSISSYVLVKLEDNSSYN